MSSASGPLQSTSVDEIVRLAEGPERLTAAAINALLYLPGHAKDEFERALLVPALSAGFYTSESAVVLSATLNSRSTNAWPARPRQAVGAPHPGLRATLHSSAYAERRKRVPRGHRSYKCARA